MYEVEVKARLKNREAVIKKLNDFGCKFGEELHQVDHIFNQEGVDFPPPLNSPVLRVRKQNDIYLFTLKISQGNRTDSLEREIEIKDGEKMIEILKLIKWKETILVDKKRIKTNVKDMEIVLDTVKDLGEFIEAEKIVVNESQEDRKKIQEELFDFLETLGIPKEDHVVGGKYDIMLEEVYEKLVIK
ncbi:class IV adenylate cyclase [Candidatus Nomurabacteria bacterium]|nr:class IV adenylate cyclase [Candidatus Nomurabacteria bacterium]